MPVLIVKIAVLPGSGGSGIFLEVPRSGPKCGGSEFFPEVLGSGHS
jgi:hypothetical protein